MAERTNVHVSAGGGTLWFGGWLFSVGFLDLDIIGGVIALLLWPYCMGKEVADRMDGTPDTKAATQIEETLNAAG